MPFGIYRPQANVLTVNLTVKILLAFCFEILPSGGPPDCAKPCKSWRFRQSGSPGLGNHRVLRPLPQR